VDREFTRHTPRSTPWLTTPGLEGSARRSAKSGRMTSITAAPDVSLGELRSPSATAPPPGAASNSPFLFPQVGTAFERVRRLGVERRFSAGEYLYRQGDPPTAMHYTLSGRVRIFVSRPDGTERTIALAQPQTIFGEFALFGDAPCPTSAVAIESCRVVAIDRAALIAAGAVAPEILFEIARQLSQKTRLLSMHVVTDGLPAGARAAMILVNLLDAYGVVSPDNTARLSDLYRVDDLAHLIGVTRVTMSRELSRLVARKIVAKRRREIVILDMAALRAIVEDYFA